MPKGVYKPFTKAQEDFIKDNYLHLPIKALAKKNNCSFGRIDRYLKKHNLVVSKELRSLRKKRSFFSKGHVPANKGKKQEEYLSKEAIEKVKKTQFKKGDLPYNTYSKNTIVQRKDSNGRYYKFIRIKPGKWEHYHRYLWEKHCGPIPENHLVIFKDGNSTNVTLENLKVISKEENMLRNSFIDIPKEIIPSLALFAQLEKKLKQITHG